MTYHATVIGGASRGMYLCVMQGGTQVTVRSRWPLSRGEAIVIELTGGIWQVAG